MFIIPNSHDHHMIYDLFFSGVVGVDNNEGLEDLCC